MDVVLTQDVDKLGLRGEVVNVARGYARNFLLPRGLAEPATPALLRELERRDAQRARHEAKTVDEAKAIAARIEKLELRFDVTAGPTGALFGSVTATNVADRLWEDEKLRVDRRKLQMATIKRIGRYTVPFEVFPEVVAELKARRRPGGPGAAAGRGARRARGCRTVAAAAAEAGSVAEAVEEEPQEVVEIGLPVESEPEAESAPDTEV